MKTLYNVEYLPVARKDMMDIVGYISRNLSNPDAAERLAVALVEKGESLREMPYINPAYTPIKPLNKEYRKARVNNYMMFYWVDEQEKKVTIARIIYSRRDYEKLLV